MKSLFIVILFANLCGAATPSPTPQAPVEASAPTTVVEPTSAPVAPSVTPMKTAEFCEKILKKYPGPADEKALKLACEQVELMPECVSVEGSPIFHYTKKSTRPEAPRVLVFSLIHGDEIPAGTIARLWMQRLQEFDPRNEWRIIPVLNPDGAEKKTRTNARQVDLNRNFPTVDWDAKAIEFWKKSAQASQRKFPGSVAGSEPEIKCALHHIEDFKPDFIVSIHTPLNVLDFDGPKDIIFPKYDYLPWKSLGHYPGSLGRYMWFERQRPVLTLEWKENIPSKMEPLEQLHDVIGQLVKYEMDNKKKM